MMRSLEEINTILDRLEPIIKEFDSADDKFKRGQWSDKFSERFKPYEEKLKRLNGDDFDIMKESYDEHNSEYSDLSDDDYADALENNIKDVLKRIWPEADEEQIEQAAEEIADETEGDSVTVTEVSTEAPKEEEDKEEKDDSITSDEDAKGFRPVKIRGDGASGEKNDWPGNPKTIRSDEDCKETYPSEEEKFIKELEDYKANMPQRK